jgi:hypothetical protein
MSTTTEPCCLLYNHMSAGCALLLFLSTLALGEGGRCDVRQVAQVAFMHIVGMEERKQRQQVAWYVMIEISETGTREEERRVVVVAGGDESFCSVAGRVSESGEGSGGSMRVYYVYCAGSLEIGD